MAFMAIISEPIVHLSQALKVHAHPEHDELMVQSFDSREAFAARLHAAMDALGMPLRGRAAWLASQTRLTPKACGKWLNAESMPDTKRLEELAKLLRTTASELLGAAADQGADTREDDTVVIEIAHQAERAPDDIELLRNMVQLWAGDPAADGHTVVVRRGGTLIPPGTHVRRRGGKPAEPVHDVTSRSGNLTDRDDKKR